MLKSKRSISIFLSLALTLGAGMSLYCFADEVKTITIVHTNDVHGRAQGDDKELIGYARLKTFVDEQKSKNPNTLLVDAGDTLHGTTFANVSEGQNMIELMNDLGYVLSVPGNHDFNYGYERLVALSKKAKFSYLCANVVKKDGSSDFRGGIVQEVDGIKVGFFGLATPETKYKSSPKNTQNVDFLDYIEASKKQVAELKKQDATVIVAVTHLGLDQSSKERSDLLAKNVEGIDLIIDGHSHTLLEKGQKVGISTIAQTGEYLKNIGVVELKVKDGKVEEISPSVVKYEQAKTLKSDAKIESAIKAAEEKNKPALEKKVGTTLTELVGNRERVRVGETNLGDLVTDAMKKSVSADVAITNGGGIRASIDKGDITMGEILTSFPFTNFVVGLEVKGSDILAALEHGVDKAPESAGKFPHVSGITFSYDITKTAGHRVTDVMINGEKIDNNKIYKLATNDFVSIGGDDYKMFVGAKKYAENALLSDVLVEYIKENGGKVDYKDEPMRIKQLGTQVLATKSADKREIKLETKTNETIPTTHKIMANNKAFTVNGYMIKGKKYFKIRDFAIAFKDSKTPFDVGYNAKSKAVIIKSNKKYSGNDSILQQVVKAPKIVENKQRIIVNGKQNSELKVYIIGGSTFFAYEDMIKLLNLKLK